MKLSPYFAGLPVALLLSASLAAAEKDIITQSFSVKPGGKLVMNVDRGSIKVNTTGADTVDVKVVRHMRKGSESKAREIYEKHKIAMSQSGNDVMISVDRPKSLGGGFNNPFNNLQVDYTVTVPANYNLEVQTSGGNIDVADLNGEIRAKTGGGNLNFGTITGPIDAQTSGGNINVQGGKGNSTLRTSGGDVKIREIDGDLTATTSGGNIFIDRVVGTVRAETSGGNIKVLEAHGPISARTSGGNVSAQLMEQPTADCALKTSGGNVAVTLNQKIAVDVNARTSGGSIRSDFAGDMNKQRTKLVAQVNGGGPDLVLETSGGDVDIRRK